MLYWPIDVTFTTTGDAYLLDWNNHALRHLQADGTLQTVVGTGFVGDGPADRSDVTPPGAPGTSIDLNHPTQLAELPSGELLLVSWHNHKLRRYDPATGLALVTCGSGAGFGGDHEAARDAMLNQPTQVAGAPDGSLYILDMRNQVIRKIGPDGIIETVAGTPAEPGYDGDGGPPLQAHFAFPAGSNPPPGGALALDAQGRLLVSDTLNHAIRRIDFTADLIETIAGTGEAGYGGDGGPAVAARLNQPRDLQLSPDGATLYIADELNHRVRAVDLASGVIETVAGDGAAGYDGEGARPTETSLNRPAGLAFDAAGALYIADTYNHRVRTFRPGAQP
jgi:DNA-binding beta-propeller fold protein YncE